LSRKAPPFQHSFARNPAETEGRLRADKCRVRSSRRYSAPRRKEAGESWQAIVGRSRTRRRPDHASGVAAADNHMAWSWVPEHHSAKLSPIYQMFARQPECAVNPSIDAAIMLLESRPLARPSFARSPALSPTHICTSFSAEFLQFTL